MNRALPPLNALRAFEAAARHLSFTKAAEELHVTPAAVGHQVKALEDHLGVLLFRRLNRKVLLTDAGQACLPALRDGFDRLAEAVEALRARDGQGVLMLSVAPTFAAKWLVPRLHRFTEGHLDITPRIETTNRVVDLVRENVDVAVRFGPGKYPGLRVDRLFPEEVFPACSPRLRDGQPPLRSPEDLCMHTLLHLEEETVDRSWPDWPAWLRAAGVADIEADKGPRFTQTLMAALAAVEGQGVALVGRMCIEDDLAAGRLVRPFGPSFRTDFQYEIVSPGGVAAHPKVAAFRDWVLAEAMASAGAHESPNVSRWPGSRAG